ncbi:MAG: SpoIIE family protein phosphatase [Oscillospiraceae bacterium]|nr:SpoIIE family protein phosphatase [Oscillospiraceae bacterium]
MKAISALRREHIGRGLACVARGLLAALLANARIYGGYAPFVIGMVAAAGPGWPGLAALLGALAGAMMFLNFSHALRTVACCVLLFTANNAFCELKSYEKPWFLPALTGALTLIVEAIYVYRSRSPAEAAYCAIAVALAALYAFCCRAVFGAADARRENPRESLVALLGVLAALAAPQFRSGFAPGRMAAVLSVLLIAFDRPLSAALAAALCVGLAMDLTAPGMEFPYTAGYGFGALLTSLLGRKSRVRAAGVFALATVFFVLPMKEQTGLMLLYENLAGTLLFLLLPTRLLRSFHEDGAADVGNETGLRRRLIEAAAALRELHGSIARGEPPAEENPAVVYDRAAEAVCRDCSLRERCWVNEYNRTYTALSDATAPLLQSGQGSGKDFPAYFADRCIRFPAFLAAVNTELRAYLLRRQYRLRLEEARARSVGQYAQFSDLLTAAAECPAGAEAMTAALPYRVGVSQRARDGERVSGDSALSFEPESGRVCLLLSDGMGSGEEARQESAQAVRLLERFLRSGVDAAGALRTLNSALNLRAETTDSFTTVDLLTLSLRSGEGEVCKYGAAPSYVKRDDRVWRIGCTCLPAGLAEDAVPPETTHVRLGAGSYFVMVTDGVADASDDGWLQELLTGWKGDDPQQLSAAILAESYRQRGGADDALALALYLRRDGTAEV